MVLRRTGTLGTLAAFASVAFLALASSQCGHSRQESVSSFPRSETLYLGGMYWGEPTSFNPLLTEPAWPSPSSDQPFNLLYEPLLLYNFETGKMEPLLAESYSVGEDAIEVVLNPAARWSDGRPVTGWDVAFTFELGQKYKSLAIAPRWTYIHEIRLADDHGAPAPPPEAPVPADYPRRVVFVLEKERRNPLVVLDALQDAAILPRHVFEPLLAGVHGDIDEFTKLTFDHDPVGSGPYRLLSYSSEKIVIVRDDHYWGNAALHGGKLPTPKYMVNLIYKSNDHFSVALQQGRMDASNCFVPRIWLKQKKGVRSWYDHEPFFVSASMPMLIPNVTHHPVNDVRLRRAMAFGINYRDIRELAVSGYSEPIKPGLVLPFGLEGKYYSADDAQKYGAYYDRAKARELLKEAGYTPIFNSDGELVETRDSRGIAVPTMYIKSPTGWSDYESIVRIAVQSLRDAGIDVRERFVDASLYWLALNTGDFDLILHQPTPAPLPSQPWTRFENILSSQDWAPEGEKMYKDIGRFNNPAAPDYNPRIDELLKTIPAIRDEAQLTAAYREINVIFMQAQVTFPLVYRPDQFYEFSVKHWENFPTVNNPYVPPQVPGDRLGTEALWAIRPVGGQ